MKVTVQQELLYQVLSYLESDKVSNVGQQVEVLALLRRRGRRRRRGGVVRSEQARFAIVPVGFPLDAAVGQEPVPLPHLGQQVRRAEQFRTGRRGVPLAAAEQLGGVVIVVAPPAFPPESRSLGASHFATLMIDSMLFVDFMRKADLTTDGLTPKNKIQNSGDA